MNNARTKRDLGIQRSIDKANRDRPNWSEDAMLALEVFCVAHGSGHRFMTEHVREYVTETRIVDEPVNDKAWGAVMQRAAKNGLIKKVGYAPSKSSNLSPKVLWGVA